jgi:hypothetical protein
VTAFDILFILLFVAVVGSLLYALAAAATGHRSTAGKLLRRLAATVLAYLAVVYVVAVLSSGRVLALDENKCSDDWCIAVSGVREGPESSARMYDVTFRLSSRARRISQRERGVVVYMRDANGRRYDGESGPADAPFDVRLGPQETVVTHRRFFLPRAASARDVVITRGGFPFPGCCIIGEATGLLHPAAVHVP